MNNKSIMKFIDLKGVGGPEVLVPQQQEIPSPEEGEVLIKVGSAGINRPDVMQREGNMLRLQVPQQYLALRYPEQAWKWVQEYLSIKLEIMYVLWSLVAVIRRIV